ncbi:uncharacterized protein [Nicotiana tomentosiformis]|uniref:uncharacterized protein n=1 Tax=Nicotiana tomentosiformis TaxID=4098 RepID=UPI00388CDF48
MGSLAFISAWERPLDFDIQSLANRLMTLDITEPIRVIAYIVALSSLFERIKARQFDGPHLLVHRETMLRGDAKEVTIDDDGVLRLQGRLCVPTVDELRETILDEVKCEHQRLGGILQQMVIPEWKWKHITMDFIVGFPQTFRKLDAIWIIVDRLTKSSHFISVIESIYSLDIFGEQYRLSWEQLSTSQSRHKSYIDQKALDLSFMVGEKLLLNVLPMKGITRFRKKDKLSIRFIGPFEVLE